MFYAPELRNTALLAGLASVALVSWPAAASATYSIAAVDQDTDQVGGAAATCLDGRGSVGGVYGSAVGAGVVKAQALVDEERRGRERAVELLEADTPPDEIIAEITDPSFDPLAAYRQYGVVDLSGDTAGFTGDETGSHASDRQGQAGAFAYSVQGNLLTSEAVIAQTEDGFVDGGCDLADRLILALEAGAEGGEGDNRCTDDGYPADTALLQVDRPGEPSGSWLRIEVEGVSGRDALPVLRQAYDAWRADHPCPSGGVDAGVTVDAGAIADAGSGSGGDGDADDGATDIDAGDRKTGDGSGGCAAAALPPGPPAALATVLLGLFGIVRAQRAASARGRVRALARGG